MSNLANDEAPQTNQLSPEDAAAAAAAGINMAPAPEAPQGSPERPEHIPEKFWDAEKGEVRVEAMAKSYAELEKGGKPKDDAEPEVKPEVTPDEEAAREAVESTGLDFDAMSAEFAESGELSEATMKALEDGGIPKAVVDQYIAGVQATAATMRSSIMDAAGGEEGYQSLISWASGSDNVSEAEAKAFNDAVNSGNADQARMAIAGMAARQKADEGSDPNRVVGGKTPAGSADVYTSNAQVTADMNNAKYASDPAYRQRVLDKLARSPNV